MEAVSKPMIGNRFMTRGIKHMPYKKIKKIIGQASTGLMAASLLDDIASASHGDRWDMEYYDKKFTLISTNMAIINEEVTAIATTSLLTSYNKQMLDQ